MRRSIGKVVVNGVGIVAVTAIAVAAGSHFQRENGALPSPFHVGRPAPPLSYLGVYEPASPHSYAGIERFSRLIGRSPNLALYYSSWWEPFQLAFARMARAHQAIPLVQLEPRNVNMAGIEQGQYDSYLRAFARAVKSLRRPVVFSFGHEMNADWYGWGYRHTAPSVFVADWRHIHRVFAQQGATNVTWLWTVNVVGGPDVSSIRAWWPGSSYVTWVGIDGHYFTPSIRFASLFGATLGQVRELTGDPVLISEAGIAPFVSVDRIIDLFAGARTHGLIGVVWFDERGHNLRIEGDPAAIADFRLAVRTYLRHGQSRRRMVGPPGVAHAARGGGAGDKELSGPSKGGSVMDRTRRSAVIALAIALAMLPALATKAPTARADEVTISRDLLRTGWDPSEPALTQAALTGGSFGELFSVPVNGEVYAQPLVVGSAVIVATENDWVYSLDRTTGAVNWSLSLGTPWPISSICTDLTPDIGVTGTPVYDPSSGTIYLVAVTIANSLPSYSLYGISAQAGTITEQVPISGSPTNDPDITFNSAQQFQRPGLLLMNGWVYAAFGSHCDGKPYDGYVVGVNVTSQATTMWSDEAGVTDDEAGIWQGGGGLMSDGPGRIFVVTGNGVSPAPGPGGTPPGQLAESVVRLAVQSDGSLVAQDFFSPKNAPTLDAQDLDFGSGGAVGLPFSTSAYSHMLVAVGKYGRIYLLNRDNLGGREQGSGGGDAVLRIICCFQGEWGHPAAFADTPVLTSANSGAANDFLYAALNTDHLREMKWAVDSTGLPNLHTVATSSNVFGYTSGSPVVTSNGTDPTSAIVWAVGVTKSTGVGGTLYAFSAVPPSTCTSGSPCTISPLWSAPIGTASKFTTPATDGGDVYLGTRDGNVYGFGITTTAPLAGVAPAAFGQVAVGRSASKQITVTATRTLTVTGVSTRSGGTADPFSVGQVTETRRGHHSRPVRFPVVLSKGDALHSPVTFSPVAPGGVAGALSFATRAARLSSVSVALSGDGTAAGLFATPSSVRFALAPDQGLTAVPVGTSAPTMVEITNDGTLPQTVSSATAPARPFSASGLPAPGTVIQPGQSIDVQVRYTPTRVGSAKGRLTISGSAGHSAVIALSGVSQPAISRFTATRGTVNFGKVRTGTKVTATVDVSNSGNQPSIMTRVTRPRRPFGAPFVVARGLPVNPGYDLSITLTFRPGKAGPFTEVYRLTWHDKFGTHHLDIRLTGRGVH